MSRNTWGRNFCIHSFGESHGEAMGVIIDGCPAGVTFDERLLLWCLERRRPGQSELTSSRREPDQAEVLSGVFEGKTLGTPIAIVVRNKDSRSQDYDQIRGESRPGHADDVWKNKFGHVDHRGGGRSSGRETISRVMAGSVAEMLVRTLVKEIEVYAYSSQIGAVKLPENIEIEKGSSADNFRQWVDSFPARVPHTETAKKAKDLLLKAKKDGFSYGGEARLVFYGVPAGLGQPVFHKLKSDLAGAMMSVGATCSVELGGALNAIGGEGSQFHDPDNSSLPNRYGGVRGGISTGEKIIFNVGFKPTSSVLHIAKNGRHDPCIVPRAIPVLEAMGWLVLADHLLWQRLDRV